MNTVIDNQEISTQDIKHLLDHFNLTYQQLGKIFTKNGRPRTRQQVSDAVNTYEQKTLRKKIINHLLKKISTRNLSLEEILSKKNVCVK